MVRTVFVYSIIKQLRRNGKRRSDMEVSRDDGVRGCLSMYTERSVRQLQVTAWGDPVLLRPLIPTLYRAEAVVIGRRRMLFQGPERVGPKDDSDSQMVFQEWTMQILDETPGDEGKSSPPKRGMNPETM